MCSLAGGHDLRCVDAQGGIQGVAEPPGKHPATGPVRDAGEMAEAPTHEEIGDVYRPHLSRAYLGASQEVGVDLAAGREVRGLLLGNERGYAHLAQKGVYVVAFNEEAAVPELVFYLPAAVEGEGEVNLVDGCHEDEIAVACAHRLVVEAGAGQVEHGLGR